MGEFENNLAAHHMMYRLKGNLESIHDDLEEYFDCPYGLDNYAIDFCLEEKWSYETGCQVRWIDKQHGYQETDVYGDCVWMNDNHALFIITNNGNTWACIFCKKNKITNEEMDELED